MHELKYMRDRLDCADGAYPGACDMERCHRVARNHYETEKWSLRLCLPCGSAFQRGLFDRDVAVHIAPISVAPSHADDATAPATPSG